MYPGLNLYENYIKYSCSGEQLPDVTMKTTIGMINRAINLCDSWNNFMDIGGGTGKNAVALSKVFKHGTLVEIFKHEEHLDIKRKFANIEIVNDLIENYKITNKRFDFVLLADLFEHIPDIDNFIKKISELQTPTGVVYMMTPNPFQCGPATESQIYHTKKEYGHIKHYTSQEIIQLMEKVGYRLIFKYHEESNLRRRLKNYIKSIARKDLKWKKCGVYKIIRPITILFSKLLFRIIERIVYNNELKNMNNPFSTITQDLAFKKIP